MTWQEIISKATGFLNSKNVPDARVASELLAARLLRVGRGMLAGELEKNVPEKCLEAMRRGMARLVKGEPVQYVLGEWDFRTLTLRCDRRALIPRPETEELVTRVLSHLHLRLPSSVSSPLVVDVGTGTGAIILSLAKEFKSDAIFLGTDVSEEAIALAKQQAEDEAEKVRKKDSKSYNKCIAKAYTIKILLTFIIFYPLYLGFAWIIGGVVKHAQK